MNKSLLISAALSLFCLDSAPAQNAEKFVIRAVKTSNPPVIDGGLDEEEWRNAATVTGLIQFEPHKGEPASVMTVFKILYDRDYIYFGFICHDPEPEKIQLGPNRRDGISSGSGTDVVTVKLDTFNDRRSAYFFRTNPAGVQHDGRVSDGGLTSDTDWDGVYKSAGAYTETGWSAEMAIPFSTIKYRPGKNQSWGLNFSRYFPRNIEKSFWTGPLEDYRRLSDMGSLTGLDLENSSARPELIPHVISQSQKNEGTHLSIGLDARQKFSQSVSGYLTANPDFSTIEADREQVNLTRFELNLPEKRPFFLEGNDAYKQRIRLFYSRRIADIYGGLKVYGKLGSNEISAITTQAKKNEEELLSSANYSVFRMKRDVLGASVVGVTAANRYRDGRNQGTAGLDTSLIFTDKVTFTGQFATSYGDGSKTDYALFLRPAYDSQTFHTHFRYTFLGENFGDNANAVGFIRDDNRHELDTAINKTFWMRKWGLDRFDYSSNYNIYWGMDKTLRSWDVWQKLSFDLQNKFSFGLRHEQEYKLFEKDFRNNYTTFDIGYNTREWQQVFAAYQFGENFDSDFTLITAGLQQNITRDLSVEYSLSKLDLTPDPENESTWIHIIVANQYFTKDLYLKLFYQVNTSIDKNNIQLTFAYRFQPPFGLVQVAYQKGTAEFGEAGTQGHTLFLKFAYVF